MEGSSPGAGGSGEHILHLPTPHHHSDWSSWLSGETQQLSCPCSATQTWLLSPHLPADQALNSTPDTGKLPQSSGGTAQPGLPLPAQAQRKEPEHPCTHARLGHVHATAMCASTAGGHSLQLTGGFQQEQPELPLNWCPSTESSKLHPQPPQHFLPRTCVRKGREVCTLSPVISGFLCCSGTVQTSLLSH